MRLKEWTDQLVIMLVMKYALFELKTVSLHVFLEVYMESPELTITLRKRL